MKVRKEISTGTYCFTRTKDGHQKTSDFGGTNAWDSVIEAGGLSGKILEVILREKD